MYMYMHMHMHMYMYNICGMCSCLPTPTVESRVWRVPCLPPPLLRTEEQGILTRCRLAAWQAQAEEGTLCED